MCCTRTSRAHKYVIPKLLVPQVNVRGGSCYPCAFISHVWSPFHGCRDPARYKRILSTRNITCTHKDVLASLVPSQCCVYDRLTGFHVYCDCPCDTHVNSITGAILMHPKNSTRAIRGFRAFFSPTMSSSCPSGGCPKIQNIAMGSDYFLENSRHHKIEYGRIELLAPWNQQNDTSSPGCQEPTCFLVSMQWSGSESSCLMRTGSSVLGTFAKHGQWLPAAGDDFYAAHFNAAELEARMCVHISRLNLKEPLERAWTADVNCQLRPLQSYVNTVTIILSTTIVCIVWSVGGADHTSW